MKVQYNKVPEIDRRQKTLNSPDLISSSDTSSIVLQTVLCNSADVTRSRHVAIAAKHWMSSSGLSGVAWPIDLCFSNSFTDDRTLDESRPAAAADLMLVS